LGSGSSRGKEEARREKRETEPNISFALYQEYIFIAGITFDVFVAYMA